MALIEASVKGNYMSFFLLLIGSSFVGGIAGMGHSYILRANRQNEREDSKFSSNQRPVQPTTPLLKKIITQDSDKSEIVKAHPAIQSANEWWMVGGMYFKNQNYSYARACFELAIKKNNTHVESIYHLGLIFQYGLGCDQDHTKAKECFEFLASNNHPPSERQLRILKSPLLSSISKYSYQCHLLELESTLQKIELYFPWVRSTYLILKESVDDFSDFVVEFDLLMKELGQLKNKYQKSPTDILDKNILTSVQSVFKFLKTYEYQLKNRTPQLLGKNAPDAQKEIEIISKYLSEYKKLLNELVERITTNCSSKSPFFSAMSQFEKYPNSRDISSIDRKGIT